MVHLSCRLVGARCRRYRSLYDRKKSCHRACAQLSGNHLPRRKVISRKLGTGAVAAFFPIVKAPIAAATSTDKAATKVNHRHLPGTATGTGRAASTTGLCLTAAADAP